MVQVKNYYLPPTPLVPNSPRPLLHYISAFPLETLDSSTTQVSPVSAHQTFERNGWRTQWIFRYGDTQESHYHSGVHECMAVLTGEATIRFGVADDDHDHDGDGDNENHESTSKATTDQNGPLTGIELHAKAGDVFILPAGTAHKTFQTTPRAPFALLTPGDGHQIPQHDDHGQQGNVEKALAEIKLTGFTMIGAYPVDGGEWDFQRGGEDVGRYEKVWNTPKPSRDPVLGMDESGLVSLWA